MSAKANKPTSTLAWGSATTIGRMRTNNEDAYLVANPLFAVADGMGGHEAGEIASKLAINTLKNCNDDLSEVSNLRKLVMRANVDVLEAPRQGIGRVGMGTTLTAAVIDNDRLLVAQVGDSRAYLMHNDHLRQVTRDHSYVQELLSSGEITEEQTRDHPRRGVITRVLGFEYETQPDLYELRLEAGDRLLLCSDGLHGMLQDKQIATILSEKKQPQQCADALVQAANRAGGQDNTTVVVVDVQTVAPAEARFSLKSRLRLGVIGFLIALALLVGGTVAGVWFYANSSAYLIAEDGQVVIYRGLVGDVFGFTLQWPYEETGIRVSDLKTPLPERLEQGIQLDSIEEAEQLVEMYREQIAESKP